jgi:hypothetical protein
MQPSPDDCLYERQVLSVERRPSRLNLLIAGFGDSTAPLTGIDFLIYHHDTYLKNKGRRYDGNHYDIKGDI